MVKDEISKAIANTAYHSYERKLLREVLDSPRPHHLAIIMDGNRRFAQEIGLETSEGHIKGKEKLEEVMEWCMEVDVNVLTVYAFSTENLNRDEDEVKYLMDLFEVNFYKLAKEERVHKNRIKVTVMGQRELLPQRVQDAIKAAEDATASYDGYFYNIALAYGSRQEIVQAIRQVAQKVKDGDLKVDDIDEKLVSSFLYTKDFRDPDLVLRTSGEERVSNFLLWQMAYSELYFTDVYWPGFRKVDFLRAIRTYQMRQRRFGK
jgi:tritrans,polycis-undecaprenyl-diphosphate synthase [geranylgeranyl-diphosphate specific]